MVDNKEQMDALTIEIENENNQNENLIAENEDMRVDMANKASTLARCAEAVHKARDQMRMVKEENRELRRAKYNNPKMDKLKRRQEEEIKAKDEKKTIRKC